MKPKSLLLATISLALLADTSVRAQLITASATQPTIGTNDIASYTEPVGVNDGNQDYSNNVPLAGETFTTSGAFPALSLKSVTVQGVGDAGTAGGSIYQAATYTLTLYSVTAGTATALQSSNFTFADKTGATNYSTNYLTFNLTTPVTLAANTQYAYTIAASGGCYGFAGSSPTASAVAGGDAVGIPAGGGAVTDYVYSRNFDVALTAVPEPSAWVLLSVSGLVGGLFVAQRRMGQRRA